MKEFFGTRNYLLFGDYEKLFQFEKLAFFRTSKRVELVKWDN